MDTLLEHQVDSNEVPCLLIPMANSQLLLPTVTIAEMIPYQSPQKKADPEMPQWFLGYLPWRGLTVPMLSFERITGQDSPEIDGSSQISVFNNTGVSAQLPFLAIPTTGIPHLSRITPERIIKTDIEPKPYEIMCVSIADEEAIIPDVSALEHSCADLLGLELHK